MKPYTLLLTSCDRHDLLRETLESFCRCAEQQPVKTAIVEDSNLDRPEWLSRLPLGKLTWIKNEVRMGQLYSCDRLWQHCDTEYAFWCEDDWRFLQTGFLDPSLEILEKHNDVWTVALRGDTGWHTLVTDKRFPFAICEPYWHGGWGGFTFNPGLRRRSDYLQLGSYGRIAGYGTHGLNHELQLSKLQLDQGKAIAALNVRDQYPPFVQHIGNGRSRAIQPLPTRPRILIAVPACDKFEYGQWESKDDGTGYGVGIHVSGDNLRIRAVRESWWRDVRSFPNVTARFFYGTTEGTPCRHLETDEVRLTVPDDYAHLPHKTIAICKWARDNDFDYVFKCDDDTYVYVDRLIRELLENRFDYAGFEHNGVATGGPGYWLNKRAINIVANSPAPQHWAEDCWTARVLGERGIRPLMLPNHHPGFSAHWFDLSNVPKDAVTLHAVKPEGMYELYSRR